VFRPQDLPGFTQIPSGPAPRVFYSEFQLRDDEQVCNGNVARLCAQRYTRDWLRYLTSGIDAVYRGILPWTPEGITDWIEWTLLPGNVTTRIRRVPYNDL